jgi:KDO2-lipid IV(A) lauroyltransferase
MKAAGRQATSSSWKRLRHRLGTLAVRALAGLAPRLSRSLVYRVGHAVGWLVFYFSRDQRRVALANLDVAFGDSKTVPEKRRIARASFQNAGATLLALLWAPRLTGQVIEKIVELDPAHLAQAKALHARGKGLIFASAHYGDWELLSLATGFWGLPMNVVVEQMNNAALQEIFSRLRAQSGHTIIPQGKAATKLLRALRRGECTALLIDINAPPRAGGVWVDFFGLPVFNTAAVAGLALHTGAPIVLATAEPLRPGRARIASRAVIEPHPTGNTEADLRALSQQCLTGFEQIIRQQPELWLWSYKRWNYRPRPDKGRYPFYSRYVVIPRPARDVVRLDEGRVVVSRPLLPLLQQNNMDSFDTIFRCDAGELIRAVPGRSTRRIELAGTGNRSVPVYLKCYDHTKHAAFRRFLRRLGWARPADEASYEWRKIYRLRYHGFNTPDPIAVGREKRNGRVARSFVMTAEIAGGVGADDYLSGLDAARRRQLVATLAELTRRFHESGFVHKDYFLGHIFVVPRDGKPEPVLLDLQRVIGPGRFRSRWLIKDLAALAYSALKLGVPRTDLMRFYRQYAQKQRLDETDKRRIRKILARTQRLMSRRPKYGTIWDQPGVRPARY